MNDEESSNWHFLQSIRKTRDRLRREFADIENFLCDKQEAGLLTKDQRREIGKAFDRAFNDSGIDRTDDSSISNAVFAQANHQMKVKILSLHPEWRQEVERLRAKPRPPL